VTGVRDQVAANVPEAVARIRAAAGSLPVVVGFGVSTRAHVAEIAAYADGVVIGSALVNCIRDNLVHRDRIAPALAAKAADFALGVCR
jgi:tryptophan synthase alpha chain